MCKANNVADSVVQVEVCMCFISIESRASASAAFITFYQRGNTRGRTKTKQKKKYQPIKVGMRWDVGAQAVLRPL